MKKKILLGVLSLAVVTGGIAAFSAFEAHIINVTARIENALYVPLEEIDFGTVFPQEELYKSFDISLSDSFIAETRVDDVQYRIRQKPKCGITTEDGTVLVGETATGHISVDPQTGEMIIDCGSAPRELKADEEWGVLPLLCPYLSKHKAPEDTEEDNDEEMDAFHLIGQIDPGDDPGYHSDDVWVWNDIEGYLAKSEQDIVDNWILDLKVPCFGDYCAQDWEEWVLSINPNVDPDLFVQPIGDEHKVFGCDLWIEVTGISLPPGICGKADVMLVLDRSGSIDSGELAILKTASKAFVDALSPSVDGAHMGQSSFADTGSLDLHLTSDGTAVKAAIDALVSGGFTHLQDGIELANGELADATYDRPDGEAPDYMVIITDGAPNRCNGSSCDPKASAKAAADAADTAGTIIYVVGVGTDQTTADWLRNNIATTPSHYFDAGDWSSLETTLEGLTNCK